jgi:hypothetical protein
MANQRGPNKKYLILERFQTEEEFNEEEFKKEWYKLIFYRFSLKTSYPVS